MNHVDTTKAITHVSICAGYGGIDLGLKRAITNLRTVAFSEIEAFACANLVSKMEAGLLDPAPIWTNLKTFPWAEFRDRVDILSGGYPCQPFSAAGRRKGADDPRHLWPYISAGISLMRPKLCFFENVEGHISLGLSDVIEDLVRMGYRATWGIFSATEVGAPHQRKRVFILAYNSSAGLQGNLAKLLNTQGWEEPRRSTGGCSGLGGEIDLANSNSAGGRKDRQSGESWTACTEQSPGDSRRSESREIQEGRAWPSRPGEPQHGWEPSRVVANVRQAQPTLGGDADGTSSGMDYAELCVTCDNRTDELRLLGNGVVPATAERAFITLMTELHMAETRGGVL